MRKVRGLIFGAAAAVALGGATPAFSVPIGTLGSYSGPLTIKFQNFESFTGGTVPGTISPGAVNFGVLRITSILDNNGNTLFANGINGQFLSGVFGGLEVTTVAPTGSGVQGLAKGGNVQIWLNSTNFNANQGTGGYAAAGGGCAIGGLCYNGITNVGGTMVLSLDFATGVIPGDTTNTLKATFDVATLPNTGVANTFYNVTGGTNAAQFDTDPFAVHFGTETRDMSARNTFCPNNPIDAALCGTTAAGDWQLVSNDPIAAFVVPEPTTLAVLGFGLLGLGFVVRRRHQA